MTTLIQLDNYPVADVLHILLKDKSTKQNIIWATDYYEARGFGYRDTDQMSVFLFEGMNAFKLQPRISKTLEEQQERTRKKAEVMTPVWLCNKMNNFVDEEWFGRKNVFNVECSANQWDVVDAKIEFPDGKNWKNYIDSRRIEITCGEAPYLVSRYDTTTGELILPPFRRIGLLDRKLRVVNENVSYKEEWIKWGIRALQSCYGYEYQGDNLLIARINVLVAFCDYYEERWKEKLDKKILFQIANIISWNLWQMDGLSDTVPLGKPYENNHQISIFDVFEEDEPKEEREAIPCRMFNWRSKFSMKVSDIRKDKGMSKKLFDFCIGNPPYQQESNGANANDTPVYHYFYDAAFEVSDKVELITPARFLFNAGGTPKDWNERMLNDPHFKILNYEGDASKIFANTAINGGVAITYRDVTKNYGAIGVFTAFEELNSILHKVQSVPEGSFGDMVTNRGLYKYSDLAYTEQPEEMLKTADRRIAPSAFERMPALFTENQPDDGHEYIRIYGNLNGSRVFRWFRKDYISYVENLDKYKVFISKADGAAGQIGKPIPARIIGKPVVMDPGVGCTETFITFGAVNERTEAEAMAKYVMTKFARTMIGVLKVTQNYAKPTWKKVPMQDFTKDSEINWNTTIKNIDKQLYRKYALSDEEIQFIETHVKEME